MRSRQMTFSPLSRTVPRLLPLRLPRVCVAVTGTDPAELVEKAESLVRDNTFLEFRLDYLPKPGLALPKISEFLEMSPPHGGDCHLPADVRAGASSRGSIAAQLDMLNKAISGWMSAGRR